MRVTRDVMTMHGVVEIAEEHARQEDIEEVFAYFVHVDQVFSTYKPESEVSRYARGELRLEKLSSELTEVIALGEKTTKETHGYFDMYHNGSFDPLGIVKGWAIHNGAQLLAAKGYNRYWVEIAGDIEVSGKQWRIGIRNPFEKKEVIKVVHLKREGIATSGSYEHGNHITNPHDQHQQLDEVVSITVIGPNVCEADRFATAAFAMGQGGVEFIEQLPGFEAYQINNKGIATMTSHFNQYL